MILVMMGPQASGKGTQGEMLSQKFNLPLVTNGVLLRNLPTDHPQKEKVDKAMNKGELVDQKFMASLIKERIAKPDCANGYILDGWMRAFVDLDYFFPPLDFFIYVTLPKEESIKRISGRRVCTLDGKTYNIYTLSPEEYEYCKDNLIQRADDTKEAVERRLQIFYTETMQVIEHFRKKDKVIEVDGMGTPEEVFSRIVTGLVERIPTLQ